MVNLLIFKNGGLGGGCLMDGGLAFLKSTTTKVLSCNGLCLNGGLGGLSFLFFIKTKNNKKYIGRHINIRKSRKTKSTPTMSTIHFCMVACTLVFAIQSLFIKDGSCNWSGCHADPHNTR
jgi:hypothetical protein